MCVLFGKVALFCFQIAQDISIENVKRADEQNAYTMLLKWIFRQQLVKYVSEIGICFRGITVGNVWIEILLTWSCLRWTRRPRCLRTIYRRGTIEMWYESLEIFGDAQCPRFKKRHTTEVLRISLGGQSKKEVGPRVGQRDKWEVPRKWKWKGGGREGDPKINKETTTGFRLRHTSSTPRNGTEGGGGRALWSWLPSGHF